MIPGLNQSSKRSLLSVLAVVLAILIVGAFSSRANLVIVPQWDSTITSDPAYSAITNTIMQAIAVYEGNFSNNIMVTIKFQEMSGGLGMSQFYSIPGVSYSTFRAKLVNGATTWYDNVALSHLPNTANNPVNGSSTLSLTLPNVRALGFTGSLNGYSVNPPAGQPDGTIFLDTSIMDYTRPLTNSADWDLFAVASHEIDEVLGMGSTLDGLNNGDAAPTGDISPLDLFRYDQNGNRSFNTVSNAQAYFSLDGTTRLVQFNQYDGGDFHDWYSWPNGGNPPRVQDAFLVNDAAPNLDVELIALDVIGYNLVIPKLSMTRFGANRETISWSPAPVGYVLQESTNIASTNWVNSTSGTNNPATVTNTVTTKFYRLGRD